MLKATYDKKTGFITGFYDPSINKDIPSGAVQIPSALYDKHFNGVTQYRKNGEFIDLPENPFDHGDFDGEVWVEDVVKKDKAEKKKVREQGADDLFDALLDLLPSEHEELVAAYRAAK